MHKNHANQKQKLGACRDKDKQTIKVKINALLFF